MLELILVETREEAEPMSETVPAIAPDVAPSLDPEVEEMEPDASIQVMALAPVATYADAQYVKDTEEHGCTIVEVKLFRAIVCGAS